MKRQKYYLAAGALLCTSTLGAFSPMLSVSAFDNSTDGSSYFDTNAQQCIVEGYNAENGTAITSIEEIDPSKITTLDCSNRDITNFKGIVILTSLETLNLSGNTNLALDEDFLVPDSLKTLNILGVNSEGFYLDISNNTNLENLTAGQYLSLKTSTYMEKLSDESEYAYGMNLSGLKFLNSSAQIVDETDYPAKYDSDKKIITYKDKVPSSGVLVKVGDSTYNIQSRGGVMGSYLYFEDDEPSEIQDNCEKAAEYDGAPYAVCIDTVYYGDTIDTGAFIKKHNLSDYIVSKIEIVPSSANITLTVDKDTVKKGKVGTDANFAVKYHFGLSDLSVPNTGIFASGGTTIIATTAAATITLAGTAFYLSRHAAKRQKSKVRFGRK